MTYSIELLESRLRHYQNALKFPQSEWLKLTYEERVKELRGAIKDLVLLEMERNNKNNQAA
jgi:hypothetical protein